VTANSKISDLLERDLRVPIEQIVNLSELDILRKKENQEPALRHMFREHGAALNRSLKLEGRSSDTDFDEDQFVAYYPYPPYLIGLSIDIAAGIRKRGKASGQLSSSNLTTARQCFSMLASKKTRLADAEIGVLVTIDKIYDLLEGSLPVDKQDDVRIIREAYSVQRCGAMAVRVAKAICLMELAQPRLPRTPGNIAVLLIQHVTERPPTVAVTDALEHMRGGQFVHKGTDGWTLHELDGLQRGVTALDALRKAVGTVNPRPPGWRNQLIQLLKKLLARGLNWYTQPFRAFNDSVVSSLEQVTRGLDEVSAEVVALRTRLAESEKQNASLQMHLDGLRNQLPAPGVGDDGNLRIAPAPSTDTDARGYRTAYIVGLFGTGRTYLCELIQQNLGERSRYFRDGIRFHPVPTRMIYSGHATIKYVCRAQHPPAVMSRILQAQRTGLADLIFVYRHPLDSLLTNWVWWRTYMRDQSCISGISQVYPTTADLSMDLEQNFSEFKAFADGDPNFFAGAGPGPGFLSFAEFIEETQLYLDAGATLTLRLEDCIIDPLKEFSKVADVLRVTSDLNQLEICAPRSKPYGYMSVANKVPEFRKFINGLDAKTRTRMEMLSYSAET
jgi:hypothetical protein